MTVLIVAYRSANKLEKCLRSVERHLPGCDVHVWDNSGPSCSEVRGLQHRFRHVNWHVGGENIGFAAAVNRLATLVPDRDFLLLNPDAELVGPLALTCAAIRDSRIAAAAPMVCDSAAEIRPAPFLSRKSLPWDVAHRKLTFLNALGAPIGLANRLRGTCFSNLYRSQPLDVDGYLTGACLAISRDAWDSVGPFDEEFFLYGEEADWQRRAMMSGWGVRLENEMGARHSAYGTVATDVAASRRSGDLLRASMALQLEYRYGVRTAEFYLAGVGLLENVRQKLRGADDRDVPHCTVLITVDQSRASAGPISTAIALTEGGFRVAVVSLDRLGSLPRELPSSIRLLRRPWWWPSMLPEQTPLVLVTGHSKKERAFARLFRLRRNAVCIESRDAISTLIGRTPCQEQAALSGDIEST